jgi:hypothetical protein
MEAAYEKSPKETFDDPVDHQFNHPSIDHPPNDHPVDCLKNLSQKATEKGDADIEFLRSEVSGLEQYVAKSKLRRVDHYSRMALLAAGRTLEDSKLSSTASSNRTGVIVATGYGALESTFSFLDSYIERGDKLALPTHFSNSVHNAAAAHISICYGISGPTLTVSQFDLSFISALITATTWLETDKTDAVLVGAVDEWCELAGHCMQRFSKHSDISPRSFGEGAVFFLVTRGKTAPPRYGYFKGITMGRKLDRQDLGSGDVIFSPSSAALNPETLSSGTLSSDTLNPNTQINSPGKSTRVWKRKRGGSPTDMGMDAFFAFKGKKNNGLEICCLKQGEAGMFGKMILTVPGER